MTPRQRSLARHALGLPNDQGQSYRNRYVAAYRPGHPYDDWAAMLIAEEADCARVQHDGRQRFWLTEKGAHLALDPGETLCPEDFPQSN